jgi:flagellar biosynthesis protein FlhB
MRARLRERQRAIIRQRGLSSVPEATVVITNPTELAVALRYRENIDQAPVVLAKGAARLAQRIRELAAENNIPVIQDPPLARMLFYQVEVGEEIPEDLYQAVAEILALVYRLQEKERRQRFAGT